MEIVRTADLGEIMYEVKGEVIEARALEGS